MSESALSQESGRSRGEIFDILQAKEYFDLLTIRESK